VIPSLLVADTFDAFVAPTHEQRMQGGVVKVLNYAGVKMAEIAFSEADGVPEHVDVNAEFLAVMTSKGSVHIYDVRKPKEPRALGAAGKFNLQVSCCSFSPFSWWVPFPQAHASAV
jgi:hypothetical protein